MSNFNNRRYMGRRLTNAFTIGLSVVTVVFALTFLVWILWTLFSNGLSYLSMDVFTKNTPPPGNSGGLLNAITGSLYMVTVATLIGTPIGIMAGTYLAEFGKDGWLAPATRFINDILLSAPSIVIGLFVYEVAVHRIGHFSGWAGAIALSLIVLPVVVRTTENMLQLVPSNLREAASALGSPQWKVVTMVVYRAARAGMLTGLLLAVARISGETAPLLFTALNNQFFSADLNGPMASLAVVIFQFAMSPYEDWQHLAWAGALLITLFVLGLNILARFVFRPGPASN
ncbi:MAG: phosphate ABC transporter permease PstA [Methylophilaceae bacterium]|uniref:phosphate ABC transporter permease PstA n=1 Tax=Methylovorus sp. MM2 TaxID=1848038 RepID=UPI0007E1D1C4|nr:phosphate ABC transporter permease PstA [Methylovorus sp. MM2]OAM52539.1 phosphate ABC transporter, permease protein PstA [Methylovorus sp. MM2]